MCVLGFEADQFVWLTKTCFASDFGLVGEVRQY